MPRSRDEATEIRRAQYEMPGFAAALVGMRIDEALALCGHQARRYGETAILQGIRARLVEAQAQTVKWMHWAQVATDYDCTRQAVRDEEEREKG